MSRPGSDAPGGSGRALLKRLYFEALWVRVAAQRRLERTGVAHRPSIGAVEAQDTEVLQSAAQWQQARRAVRRLRLPAHPERSKNWDSLGALATILRRTGPDATVLDAGAALYSSLLPSLHLYGYSNLVGINLEIGRERAFGSVRFRHGDVTRMEFADSSIDAIACLSVIEHGVAVKEFLVDSARVLKDNGTLTVSTDYDSSPPDTSNKVAYGVPVHIFSPAEIVELIGTAKAAGLELLGSFSPDHSERPVTWARMGLDYTYVRLSFARVPRISPAA